MNKKVIIHSLILLTAVTITFFWITDPDLNYYSLQLTAVLLLTLIVTHRILKPVSYKLAESTISTMAVLLISSTNGGISSPLFFLNYILLFELSLLLEPVIPLLLSVMLVVFYLASGNKNTSYFQYLELAAFPLITPLAVFFGKIYQKVQNQKKEIKNLSNKVEELEEELVEEEMEKETI
ncbi:hypothetical protein COV53_04770 [Candidatus Gottesmanbacteria bacterium CG11_big_fil_rev_8_21_14_0_20_37_11]|uniref:Uncharacterized protein n=3 Tax=Candidatus Gottesmaniibacteriota TaxID=1752720 RepID=A0A2M7RRT2_9BACT|nr:MAG: hypothetical protein AUJ73_04630 [Candidatus Gottesmanbacteria bacterium CG1_02_37_22]PIP32425.1 MAG: hypothetical protein COX23_04770 [Candidatus Gottesmanbacteria bacterium CG23_combo_of_CG06-09_8_20_14_all_37_19]PIR08099.1 MAG: hypothetical protein COV53_04770 [Candidatus Gottesmanbacteria bacterium CG11_big_fil_rev_8_21_14_0_20_37_11]PIZ03028.1 MAG: hypothetical protein COY59_01660 [Candidatus Gottesmanbacteria bacterium CG_4_10_14_0_8_um_filter_37_24]